MKRTTKVSVGLFATWAISDLEELWTMSRSSKDVMRKLPKALPVPNMLRREGISQRHVATGVGMMGLVMGAAATLGVRSGARSPVFRGVLLDSGCTVSGTWQWRRRRGNTCQARPRHRPW